MFIRSVGSQTERDGRKVEKRVTTLEEYVRKLEDRVEIIDEGDGIRLNLLEEKVAALHAQNHLHLT